MFVELKKIGEQIFKEVSINNESRKSFISIITKGIKEWDVIRFDLITDTGSI